MPPLSGRLVLAAAACLAIASCQEDGSEPGSDQALDPLADARTACERSGGNWGAREGGVLFTCFRETRDANRSCLKASDCQGVCLARSRTCSPVTPFLGCHEVLTEGGRTATQCTN